MTANLDTVPFDAADYLGGEQAQIALLNDAIGTGSAAYIANAVGTVARARAGMSKLARDTGIKRQTLTKSLGKKGNPTLATIVPVLEKLGLRMQIVSAPTTN